MTIKDLVSAMKYSEEIKIVRVHHNEQVLDKIERGVLEPTMQDLEDLSVIYEDLIFTGYADEIPYGFLDMDVNDFCIDRDEKLAKKILITTSSRLPVIKERKAFYE